MSEGGQQVHVLNKACDICGRCFARNEHLIRHRRIHTRERPFPCHHCRIGFPRSDVREKHVKKFHPEERPAAQTTLQLPAERTKPREIERSRLACDQCRRRKLKCSNVRPCESCRSKQLECTVSDSSRPPGRPRNPIPVSPNDPATLWNETNQSTTPLVLGPSLTGNFDPSFDGSNLMSSIAENSVLGIRDSMVVYPSISPPGMVQGIALEAADNSSIAAPFPSGSIPLDQVWEDLDMMDDLLPQAYPGNWLGDLYEFPGPDDIWPLSFLSSDIDCSSPMEDAVDMMKGHLQRRSRASTPCREEQKRSWYSAPPELCIYDEDVMNILLSLSRLHISGTFAIFSDFEANDDTRAELFLAMAAVGALYCTTEGGTKIAKKLFNDSRRLLLEEYLRQASPSFDDSLSFAKTFILLEIYGLCSGDKRAYEFIEVFHASKLHSINFCLNFLSLDAPLDKRLQTRLLSEAIQVLDSYRVLLLQLPPSFALPHQLNSHSSSEISYPESISTSGLISLLSPTTPLDPSISDTYHLTTVICYSWMASLHDLESSPYPTLWKPEFAELALNRWVQAKAIGAETSRSLEVPQMLLFHLTHVSIHSNLRSLQVLTQAAGRASYSQEREVPDSVRVWRHSPHFSIAHWHAKAILRIVQEEMAPPHRYQPSTQHRLQFFEAPHLPLCIYFATLIVWHGELARGGDPRVCDASVELGSQLLFRLKVHVSKQLGAALSELRSNDSHNTP